MDITLLKGAGPNENGQRVPTLLPVLQAAARTLPFGRVGQEYKEYKHDCVGFGLSSFIHSEAIPSDSPSRGSGSNGVPPSPSLTTANESANGSTQR